MENDTGGLLLLIISVGMVAALGVALVYGGIRWANRRTDPAARRLADQATERVYRESGEPERE